MPRTFIEKEMSKVWVILCCVVTPLSCLADDKGKETHPCEFPAIYNFGDSNSDTGGISAAFYPASHPAGETFFHSPSGRGSDGRLIIDYFGTIPTFDRYFVELTLASNSAAEHLGIPFLNSYLDTLSTSYRHGANFATGGSTIRPQNISMSAGGSSPFSLNIQTAQFNQFKSRSSNLYHKYNATSYKRRRLPKPEDFDRALYTFDIGQNDIARGMEHLSRDQLMDAIPDMVNKLGLSMQNMYYQGGRSFWIHNTGPIGCLPVTLHYYHQTSGGVLDESGCVKSQNEYALAFNRELKTKVMELRKSLKGASLVYVDIYEAKLSLIRAAKDHGFVKPDTICCGFHKDDVHVYCGGKGVVDQIEMNAGSCQHPDSHISWDGIHYTDAANRWVALRVMKGAFSDPPVSFKEACKAHNN